ncbi:phosphoribosylamine--glycine ligase [Jeotgalicoccus psychrophilus]|uniref:phosphoribosylamine--glycine ligase n=2 Tax=Jeotgalicoccus TaxID=227979 RepID=UPI0004085870|nr:phosphoribosylamine--glycine ligase [Jeotgalicoccus psychrophilus]
MNVAVIGKGGREHAIVKMLANSKSVNSIYAIPGNAGMREICEVMYRVDEDDFDAIAGICIEKQVDWVVIGDAVPLSLGLADFLIDEYGLTVFGPRKKEARMETSKSYTKNLLKKYNIPTADFKVFVNYNEAKEYIESAIPPYVLKKDGLSEGKGVVIIQSREEGLKALEELAAVSDEGDMEPLLLEEYLVGEEFSLMVMVNEEYTHTFEVIAQDHKSAFGKGDGPNTGGMGAYAPVTHISETVRQEAIEKIIEPTAMAMVKEGLSYFGVLYLGAMMTDDGVKVLEYNARFGDPEAQVLLSMIDSDFACILEKVQQKEQLKIDWKSGYTVGVMLATEGYPYEYKRGIGISFTDEIMDRSFISGLAQTENGDYISSGGRIMLVTGTGLTIEEALKSAYGSVGEIEFNKNEIFYRTDIAHRALLTK